MSKKNEIKKWFNYFFYVWCTLALLFAVLLDLICGTVYDPKKSNFDVAIIEQSIYFSVWVAIMTSFFGLINWIHIHNKSMAKWMVGKNAHTSITTLNIVIFILFNVTFIVQKGDIIGFDTWYGKTKSIIEHILTPIIVLAFYFIYQNEKVEDKLFIKKYCWFNLIFVGIYSFYIILRMSMLLKLNIETNETLPLIPYPQIDPTIVGYPIFIAGTLAGNFGTVFISIFFNKMSNIKYVAIQKNLSANKTNKNIN
ncbi:hypothetical protein [Spiroplasma cantharicola]|uniref:Transmembrane protein n=1 Tax=Spiroplasma cantharicola TaxID=362837 RepID=A0A0M4JJ16_9MOLU|nr:hypothetical protein [Spiroplasma cantharicola]ALD66703.1 hypothetical protein SCANT_v1c07970 [Spiroplasma cantharicola]